MFYDLVYVVLIGRAAHHLAEHVDWQGVRDFVVVFGMIWLAWFNGTFWHELHAREDGRSRIYIFVQMGLLALLAVFAGDATGDDGTAFAVTYAILFALFTWQWYLVHRALPVDEFPTGMTRQIAPTFGLAASIVLAIGATRPGPIIFVVAISAVLIVAWLWLLVVYLAFGGGLRAFDLSRVGDPSLATPPDDEPSP